MSEVEGIYNDLVYLIKERILDHKQALAEYVTNTLDVVEEDIIQELTQYMEELASR